jgi:branched-chain amino acid transport system permease protein
MTATTEAAPTSGRARFRFSFVDTFLWTVRVLAIVFIAWGVTGALVLTLQGDGLSGAAWRDLTITGLAQGSMYGLIALGYSMVYGVLGFINFAHGEVFMVGSMVGFFAADALAENGAWESNPIFALTFVILVSSVTSMLLAVAIERVAYRPLRGAPRIIPLITSIGMSFFIQYAIRGLFGSGFLTYPQLPESLQGEAFFSFQKVQVLVIVLTIIASIGLYFFVERTKSGRAMRAVAEDKEIAGLMGINVDRTIVVTFAVGGFMAGVAGAMWALLFRQVFFFTGFLPGIKAFTAAVLGGIGNLAGAMLGGLTLGLFESLGPQVVLGGLSWDLHLLLIEVIILAALLILAAFKWRSGIGNILKAGLGVIAGTLLITLITPAFRGFAFSITIPGLSQLKDVVAFTALVLVLIFRPTGLLGERLAVEERG